KDSLFRARPTVAFPLHLYAQVSLRGGFGDDRPGLGGEFDPDAHLEDVGFEAVTQFTKGGRDRCTHGSQFPGECPRGLLARPSARHEYTFVRDRLHLDDHVTGIAIVMVMDLETHQLCHEKGLPGRGKSWAI